MAQTTANSVVNLKRLNFLSLTLAEKLAMKKAGRHTPDLNISKPGSSRGGSYVRKFNKNVYGEHNWLCGCSEKNALFCFPCLLYGGESVWTKTGVNDLIHLRAKISKHETSTKHINNVIDLSLLSEETNIAAQINQGFRLAIARHNETVKKNREVLSTILECIKFCGKHELPLRGHDESASSLKPGVFRSLVDFVSQFDSSLKLHITSATVFKGTSKTVQEDILDSILYICRQKISEEIKNAEFLSVMIDDTTDIFDKSQMVIVFRYEIAGRPVERFWGFFNPESLTAEALSSILLKELDLVIGRTENKLIAQTYDGAAALRGINNGVQAKVKAIYPTAHFVYCYAHQLNLILEKAASQNRYVRLFFNNLSGIPAFFSKSPQRMTLLEDITSSRRIPRPSATRWNFKSRTINAVYEMREEIIMCCVQLEASTSKETGRTATGIKRFLQDPIFIFWLEFFAKIMPHVDILYNQIQSRNIDATSAASYLNAFTSKIQHIRERCDSNISPDSDARVEINNTAITAAAKEVCDVILFQCTERFKFAGHLEASRLFAKEKFSDYVVNFPVPALNETAVSYPMIEKKKLKSELQILYAREDLCTFDTLTEFLLKLNLLNLNSTFAETTKLLKILLTTPMTSAESECCFSTLKRIKTFLRNTMSNKRLNALAMLSIENKLIQETKNFNDRVMDHFARSKSRRMDFIFK